MAGPWEKYAATGTPKVSGQVEPGNIDLYSRPHVKNPDGSVSTVRSVSFNVGGKEVLMPTVSDDGRIMSNDEALQTYKRTGKHLGVFDTPQNATAYASTLHNDYAAGKYDKPAESGPWAKYGAAESAPAEAAPQNAVYPNVHPGEVEIGAAPGGFRGWLHDLEGDIRYGGDRTFAGKILKKMGAQGINVGAQSGGATELAASVPLGAIHATQGIEQMVRDPKEGGDINAGLMKYAGGVAEGAQLPGMVVGAPAAAEAVEQIGAKAGKIVDATKQAFSKGAVTKNMGSEISGAIDRVASQAGLPVSKEASLSAKATEVVGGLKKQAQTIYSELDKASGGRYQRFVDEIDTITDAMHNKYTPAENMGKLKEQLAQVQGDYAKVQQELISQGVDPAKIKAADQKWAQMKAMESVGKKFKIGESLSGDLKPGTPSIDTGLKNLKPHILPQATKAEAPAIKESVVKATKQISNVKRNRRVAAALGAGSAAYAGRNVVRDVLSGK